MITFYRPACAKCGSYESGWRIRGRNPAPKVGDVVIVSRYLNPEVREVCVTEVVSVSSLSFDWSAAFVSVPPIPKDSTQPS